MSCQCDARDPKTLLPGCRALISELDEAREQPCALDLFLLVGGDGLQLPGPLTPDADGSRALGAALHDVAARHSAAAYRMSDGIFALLLRAPEVAPAAAVAVAVEAAVAETAPWLGRSLVHERTAVPPEAGAGSAVACMALEALGRRVAREPRSPGRQSRDVLLALLAERRLAAPGSRRAQVASLAVTVGRRLDLTGDELDDMVRAAELQDVGLVALPDALRAKRSRLSEADWALIRCHPVVGERIVGAASALAPVARLVRSSYERFDGSGYPDGLERDAIPLGARVIAACVAFDAITADRPHRAARDVEAALAELEECAGTQFDPRVVTELCAVVRYPR